MAALPDAAGDHRHQQGADRGQGGQEARHPRGRGDRQQLRSGGHRVPGPGNDDSLRAIETYCELFWGAVLDGLAQEVALSGGDIGEAEVTPPEPLREATPEAPAEPAPQAAAEPAAEAPAEKPEAAPAEAAPAEAAPAPEATEPAGDTAEKPDAAPAS